MEEVFPGLLHWSTRHPDIGVDVSSYLLVDAGLAIDPLLPAGSDPSSLGHEIRAVVVTICLHTRSVGEFGVPVHAPRAGLHRWEGASELSLEPFDDGDEIVPGVRALEIGAIAPDDFALHIEAGPGALAFGDAIINYGQIGFVRDSLMDDPPAVKARTFEALRPMLDLEFDALLFAHGNPVAEGGHAALRSFVETGAGD